MSVSDIEPGKKEAALGRLLRAHEGSFDVEGACVLCGHAFAGHAVFHQISESYVLSKKAKLWGFNVHEHILFALCDVLDEGKLHELVQVVTQDCIELVQIDDEHMTTYLSLVVLADGVSEGASRAIKRCRFRKSFLLGLRGWVDLRLAVADLATGEVLTNAQGRVLAPTLAANCFPQRR